MLALFGPEVPKPQICQKYFSCHPFLAFVGQAVVELSVWNPLWKVFSRKACCNYSFHVFNASQITSFKHFSCIMHLESRFSSLASKRSPSSFLSLTPDLLRKAWLFCVSMGVHRTQDACYSFSHVAFPRKPCTKKGISQRISSEFLYHDSP